LIYRLSAAAGVVVEGHGVTASNARPDMSEIDGSPLSLLGRDDELERLYRIVDRVSERGGAFIVRGEAGIGKSALLAAASGRAQAHGVTVLMASGVESEAQLPFAGVHQLLLPSFGLFDRLPDPLRNALEMAFGLAPRGDTPDVFLVGLATLGLISEIATEIPVLLVVEDAQWLDRSSARALAFVGRRLEMEPAILLFAVRDGVPNEIDEAGLPDLPLGGLDENASRALLQVRGAGLSDDLKARILSEAAGNPLALIELPAAATNLELDARSVRFEPLPLTARLERAFAARLDDLDADARTLLLVASLDESELAEVTAAAERVREVSIDAGSWTPILAAGLGTLDPDGFRFRHPLIRSAVQRAATIEERRQAHAALAETLAADPDRAAWHQAAAASGPDQRVAIALEEAAERARLRGACGVAVVTLERSAALTGDPELRALLLWRAGYLAWEIGRWSDAARLFTDAQRLGLPPSEHAMAAFQLEALEGTMSSGNATVRAFGAIAEDLVATGEHTKALEALATVSVRAYWGKPDDDTRRYASAVAKKIEVPPDHPLRLCFLALIDPIRNGGEVVGLLRQLSTPEISDPAMLFAAGEAASAVWAYDLALPFLRAAADSFRADGRLGLLAPTLAFDAWANAHSGAVRPALTAAAEAARLSEETGQVLYAPASKLAEAIAMSQRGEDHLAEDLIAEAEAVLLPIGATPLIALVALARGRKELAAGRFSEAYHHLERLFDPTEVAYHPWLRGAALADLADSVIAGDGDLDLVEGYLGEWQKISAATKVPHLDVQLSLASAMLADDDMAEELFQDAMTSGTADWPFYTARAQLAYGAWLRRQRRAAESRRPLREAAQSFAALGQMSFAERARVELRASGETPRRRVPEAWAQLTPQELQIAQMAAEGMSNREIGERLYLSHRTVGTHLYRLFPKLGITSRTELRDALPSVADT
jgi:DNA-binding CsgD family transcriptional regulator